MSRFSTRNFVAPQEADPVASVKLVRGRFKSGRSSWSGDERGITLQTLIVTAVLVLMAVAAGVIIVAITDNSADDLEDQASDIDGRCQPWEIHDTELEAIGAGGGKEHLGEGPTGTVPGTSTGQGGVTSSKVGCLAPCYLQAKTTDAFDVHTTLLEIITDSDTAARLVFDTSNRPPMEPPINASKKGEYRLGVTYQRTSNEFDTFKIPSDTTLSRYKNGDHVDPPGPGPVRAVGTHIPPVSRDSKTAIRVTAGQDACIIFNTDTGVILLDSRDS